MRVSWAVPPRKPCRSSALRLLRGHARETQLRSLFCHGAERPSPKHSLDNSAIQQYNPRSCSRPDRDGRTSG